MDGFTLIQIATQLRKPEVGAGVTARGKMNAGNVHMDVDTITALAVAKDDEILVIGMGNSLFFE